MSRIMSRILEKAVLGCVQIRKEDLNPPLIILTMEFTHGSYGTYR